MSRGRPAAQLDDAVADLGAAAPRAPKIREPVRRSVEARIKSAAASRTNVRIVYVNGNHEKSSRTISIYGVGNGYIEAYDTRRGTVRTFRLDRIRSATATGVTYDIPMNYVPSGWVTSGSRALGSED